MFEPLLRLVETKVLQHQYDPIVADTKSDIMPAHKPHQSLFRDGEAVHDIRVNFQTPRICSFTYLHTH